MKFALRPPDLPAARALADACGISVTVAQVLLHRAHTDSESVRDFLSPKLKDLTPPDTMLDRDVAAERLARAVRAKERVVVFGDYDVDGTTSAVILGDVLTLLGADVVTLLASRFEGGYGLSDAALIRVRDASPTLVVTCDCGSSDHDRIQTLRGLGIDVIVVDHHLVPKDPLPANAFLNPHRPECGFAYKHMTSAGLALSLAGAVRAAVGAAVDLRAWLDLVALGTIADVAPLHGDNRRLVRAGLSVLSSPNARPGIAALRDVAKLRAGTQLGASDVGFKLGPRLNAAGRLMDPGITLQLLKSKTASEARTLAARIEQLNQERKSIEARVTEAAIAQVREIYGNEPKSGIVAAGRGWHRGVVGITAARLVDTFGVPSIVIAVEDGVGHGSARTPDDFPLYDCIAACRQELTAFGGHQAAAGLSIQESRIDVFRAAFHDACAKVAMPAKDPRVLDVDVVIEDEGLFPTAKELRDLEPYGEGNAEPIFLVKNARVERATVVGETHLKLNLKIGYVTLSGFGAGLATRMPRQGQILSVLGSLAPDTWRGGGAIEMRVRDFE
ncbi:MAG: single-stranded-DNA-specific exonuclease RecJ [Sandaracinaceae bacterium]|nr:single-stranded-DNA-specific exonuclease RecJ [Sandaracinaceae bacterium]